MLLRLSGLVRRGVRFVWRRRGCLIDRVYVGGGIEILREKVRVEEEDV